MLNRAPLGLLAVLVLAAAALPIHDAAAQEVIESEVSSEYQNFRLVRLAGNLENPWAVAPLTDGRMLVTERRGRLLLIDGATRTEVSGVPAVHAQGQGGLLDVVPHPDFASNGWIYLTYSKGTADATLTALARGRLEGTSLVDVEELFEARPAGPPGRHCGSRILFLGDGTLLLTVGDRGVDPDRAQDTRDHAGSVLRLNEDGSAPADNPFTGNAAYVPEIYTYGNRNVQGIALHPGTGEVWATEHGPRGSDLLQRIAAGRNYGWPVMTPGRDYRTQRPFSEIRESPRFTEPVFEFVVTLAPSGLAIVDGGDWDDTWQGNLLAGGLRAERILRLVIEDGELVHAEELLLGMIGRIRDVRFAGDGLIYIVTDEEDGGVYRLEPTT
jgi:aldose sugar dehydrogenase